MSYAEEILKIRKRVVDAVGHNVFNESNKDIVEALLIQIMNDAERNRQQCVTQAENFRKQASTMDGQAGAFASMSSIIYNVLNGFVRAAERTQEEVQVTQEEVQVQEVKAQEKPTKGKKNKK